MKRLALLAVPFLLASTALAADLEGPRYGERSPSVVVEERYHHRRAPVVEYDDEVAYVDHHPRLHGFYPPYPEYYGWFRRHHWGWPHHRHHRRHW